MHHNVEKYKNTAHNYFAGKHKDTITENLFLYYKTAVGRNNSQRVYRSEHRKVVHIKKSKS